MQHTPSDPCLMSSGSMPSNSLNSDLNISMGLSHTTFCEQKLELFDSPIEVLLAGNYLSQNIPTALADSYIQRISWGHCSRESAEVFWWPISMLLDYLLLRLYLQLLATDDPLGLREVRQDQFYLSKLSSFTSKGGSPASSWANVFSFSCAIFYLSLILICSLVSFSWSSCWAIQAQQAPYSCSNCLLSLCFSSCSWCSFYSQSTSKVRVTSYLLMSNQSCLASLASRSFSRASQIEVFLSLRSCSSADFIVFMIWCSHTRLRIVIGLNPYLLSNRLFSEFAYRRGPQTSFCRSIEVTKTPCFSNPRSWCYWSGHLYYREFSRAVLSLSSLRVRSRPPSSIRTPKHLSLLQTQHRCRQVQPQAVWLLTRFMQPFGFQAKQNLSRYFKQVSASQRQQRWIIIQAILDYEIQEFGQASSLCQMYVSNS